MAFLADLYFAHKYFAHNAPRSPAVPATAYSSVLGFSGTVYR